LHVELSTHAAVAANISELFALVKRASIPEKERVNKTMQMRLED
jgi:hypothetical protein